MDHVILPPPSVPADAYVAVPARLRYVVVINNNNRFYYRLIWSHLVGHADVCLTVGKSPSWGKPWSGLTRSLFWLQVLLRYRLHEAFLFRRGGLSPVLRVDELSKVRPILLRHFI